MHRRAYERWLGEITRWQAAGKSDLTESARRQLIRLDQACSSPNSLPSKSARAESHSEG